MALQLGGWQRIWIVWSVVVTCICAALAFDGYNAIPAPKSSANPLPKPCAKASCPQIPGESERDYFAVLIEHPCCGVYRLHLLGDSREATEKQLETTIKEISDGLAEKAGNRERVEALMGETQQRVNAVYIANQAKASASTKAENTRILKNISIVWLIATLGIYVMGLTLRWIASGFKASKSE